MKTVANTFKSYIYKANSRGAGFISLPKGVRSKFQLNDQIQVEIAAEEEIRFYAKIRKWRGLGFYIPKKIASEHNLCQNSYPIQLRKVEGFQTKIGSDGRIYIPNTKAEELGLDEGKVVEVEGKVDGTEQTVYKPVHVREKEDTTEFQIIFDGKRAGEEGVFRIRNVFNPSSKKGEISEDLRKILRGLDWIVTDGSVRVFDGNKVPVVMTKNLKLEELSYYLGAYFADGTKKGNHWGICASTFQQAKFYKRNHQNLFEDSDLSSQLTYTFHPSTRIKKKELIEKWEGEVDISVESIQEIKTETKHAENRNKYGSLYFREHKILMKEIYNRMLSLFLERIMKEGDRALAWNFVLGVMEGDGAPNAAKRGHITITTNKSEMGKLQRVFDSLGLEGKNYREEMDNHIIRVGSLELISNLELIGDELFQFYPKRREKAIRRLLKTSTAKFVLEKKKTTSGWIKAYLQEKNILDEDYELTAKGRKVWEKLKKLSGEVK